MKDSPDFSPVNPSPNAHTPEEMKSIVAQRIKEMEAGTATYVDGEAGFALIRSRYGWKKQ